jgi:hypothetical protein
MSPVSQDITKQCESAQGGDGWQFMSESEHSPAEPGALHLYLAGAVVIDGESRALSC